MKNYLNDAMEISFKKAEEYEICSDKHKNCRIRTTICGQCYQDPDMVSEQLYEDMSHYFKLNKAVLTSARKNGYLILKYDDIYEHEMSTDYIGPSRAWAHKYLDGDEKIKAAKIGDFLLITRTIGGHIFWPAHQVDKQETINQARGGSRIYDRFDITLAELKQYFNTQIECKEDKKKDLCCLDRYLYDAFKRYEWFFKEYKTFDNYISKMKLEMFLHEGNVFSLVDSDVSHGNYVSIDKNSFEPKNYEQYISNCKALILERSRMIMQ